MWYYYGGDGRLRAMHRYGRWWDPDTSTPTVSDDTWESYRYDALGRRIIKRTLHEPFCDEACTATIERTIWNGSQILVQLRASGDPADTTALSNQTKSGRDFIDSVGRSHGGIPTPHVKDFTLHVDPASGRARLKGGDVRAATQQDLRDVRNILDRREGGG
ncbi:hypothetical protein [Gaopeijia maritima]|uniref:RHS repeat protein n=1 Tax=Gaopeijia maritima TaxID=3119007 RepID=A0ABU9EBD5_9BACT